MSETSIVTCPPTITIEQCEDGYIAYCPQANVAGDGDTVVAALKRLVAALRWWPCKELGPETPDYTAMRRYIAQMRGDA